MKFFEKIKSEIRSYINYHKVSKLIYQLDRCGIENYKLDEVDGKIVGKIVMRFTD